MGCEARAVGLGRPIVVTPSRPPHTSRHTYRHQQRRDGQSTLCACKVCAYWEGRKSRRVVKRVAQRGLSKGGESLCACGWGARLLKEHVPMRPRRRAARARRRAGPIRRRRRRTPRPTRRRGPGSNRANCRSPGESGRRRRAARARRRRPNRANSRSPREPPGAGEHGDIDADCAGLTPRWHNMLKRSQARGSRCPIVVFTLSRNMLRIRCAL